MLSTLFRPVHGVSSHIRRAMPAALLVLGACRALGGGDRATLVDHHVHLLSPALMADWKTLGVNFARPDSVYTSASHLLGDRAPDAEASGPRLAGAILVPMGHLYGRSDVRDPLGLSLAAEHRAVSRENDYVAAEAARFPGRAIALCSVDYLRPYAWEELQRCREELHSPGIKLHLGSARTNLLNDGHLTALRRIARLASEDHLILLMHFDPEGDRAEVADVQHFIDIVLQPFPDLTLVIAHLGGNGGYGPWPRAILRTFSSWLAAETAAGRPQTGVHFDISGVWLLEDSEGMPRSSPQEGQALAADLAQMGVSRLLFGSDYPVFDPVLYAPAFRKAAGLGAASWDSLARNRLPQFRPDTTR